MSNANTDILLAGAAAAFTVDLLVYPLDTIKTRYQSQDYLNTFSRSGSARKAPPNVFRGLYQGVGSVIIATLPAAGVFFTTYEASKTFYSGFFASLNLPNGLTIPAPVVHSLASGTAELASCLVLTPAEVIKQNAQMISLSQGSSGHSAVINGGWGNGTSMQALRMVFQSEGGAVHRLLTGYTALAARNLPFTAIQFPMFEAARRKIWEWCDRKRKSDGGTVKDGSGGGGERKIGEGSLTRGLFETGCVNGASAGLSGAVAAVITTPSDVVKTRMMLSAGEERRQAQQQHDVKANSERAQKQDGLEKQKHLEGSQVKQQQKMGGLPVAKLVYAERGIRGLFRGGLLRAGWTAVGSGLYLGTYEVAKVWLKAPNSGGRDEDDGL